MAFLKNISAQSETPDDLELIAAYRRTSDLNILAQLYQPYLDLLYGVCLKYLEDQEKAKDAVMEIFEELTQKVFKHEITYFRGWLYTLAKNHCLMKLRSSGRVKVFSLDSELVQSAEDLHLTDKLEKEEQIGQLTRCIEKLSADQKTVIELFYLQNKAYKEIETITGLEWNKVRSYVQNGRRNLKLCMQQQAQQASAIALNRPSGINTSGQDDKDPALAV